ncbi:helix-turn-helix transcriptional regulator [Comamonas composti]|uniref:helix-turn-helix transcriptional regulator n=1 Tax=Comamonas composti TaxID=408558 RepID=UPI00146FB4B0|nr:AraC family transcriptional regulator [Comamonas composti]
MHDPVIPSSTCAATHLVEDLYKSASDVPAEWASMLERIDWDDGISIGCMQGRAHSEWEVHAKSPPMFCIAVMLEGRMRAGLDGGATLDFRPGMVSVMSTATTASGWDCFIGHSGFKMLDIRLTPQALHRLTGHALMPLRGKLLHDYSLPGLDTFMGCTPASAGLMQLASDVLACRVQTPAARQLYLRAKAQEALALVLDSLSLSDDARPLAIPADRQRLLQAKALLESSYGQDWTVQALSQAVGLNEKRLQTGFQALFGLPIHAQLMRIRMDAAADLLTQGHSVTETAYAVGYSSLSHFSKVFRHAKGTPPKQWSLMQSSGGLRR